MFVRVEYDRSNRVCIYEGQVIGLPMHQGGQFIYRGQAALASPLAQALDFALRFCSLMGSMYACKSTFSIMKHRKSKTRTCRLHGQPDVVSL